MYEYQRYNQYSYPQYQQPQQIQQQFPQQIMPEQERYLTTYARIRSQRCRQKIMI